MHLLENAIYNELRLRGFSVDVGQVVVETQADSIVIMNVYDFLMNDDSLLG